MCNCGSQAPGPLVPPASKPWMLRDARDTLSESDHTCTSIPPVKPRANVLAISKEKHNDIASSPESSVLGWAGTDDRNAVGVQILPVEATQAIFTTNTWWDACYSFTFPCVQRLTWSVRRAWKHSYLIIKQVLGNIPFDLDFDFDFSTSGTRSLA